MYEKEKKKKQGMPKDAEGERCADEEDGSFQIRTSCSDAASSSGDAHHLIQRVPRPGIKGGWQGAIHMPGLGQGERHLDFCVVSSVKATQPQRPRRRTQHHGPVRRGVFLGASPSWKGTTLAGAGDVTFSFFSFPPPPLRSMSSSKTCSRAREMRQNREHPFRACDAQKIRSLCARRCKHAHPESVGSRATSCLRGVSVRCVEVRVSLHRPIRSITSNNRIDQSTLDPGSSTALLLP